MVMLLSQSMHRFSPFLALCTSNAERVKVSRFLVAEALLVNIVVILLSRIISLEYLNNFIASVVAVLALVLPHLRRGLLDRYAGRYADCLFGQLGIQRGA